jgi:hypothetical protein
MLAEVQYSVAVPASGNLTIEFGPDSRLRTWNVQQISLQIPNAPLGCTAKVTKNNLFISAAVPAGDVVGGNPPVLLRDSDRMQVSFAGATPGTVASVYVIYDDGR